jgi:hypothetical protein
MQWCTCRHQEGPYLIICRYPQGTTKEQVDRAFVAADAVFTTAGYDPVQVGMRDTEDPFEERLFDDLWETAQKAATVAAWAPREGEPEPTEISIYFE